MTTITAHQRLMTVIGIFLMALLLTGCGSTPRHTNTLIFGTSTKFALAATQGITSGVGVAFGYSREEAVWMPLMPNQANGSKDDLIPATCNSKTTTVSGSSTTTSEPGCDKFVGTNGGNDKDTYSVLASFGAKFEGGANATAGPTGTGGANAKGEIAQYFATGLAARLLVQSGGAGLVNTQQQGLTPAQAAAMAQITEITVAESDAVVKAVRKTDSDSEIDPIKMKALLDKATGSSAISNRARSRIGSAKTVSDLRNMLALYDLDASILAKIAN